MKSSKRTHGFLSAVHFWNCSTVPQPWLPFYLILPMTDCTLFKLPVTFPLRELLHFKILIKAELPVTSRFPLIAEAAASLKEAAAEFKLRSRCKTWQSTVCPWLLSLISWPQHEAKRMWALHIRPPVTQLQAKDSEVPQQTFHSYETSRNDFLALQMLILWQTT